MTEFEFACIANFISENWRSFCSFMHERDTDEARCEDIVSELEQLGGMA